MRLCNMLFSFVLQIYASKYYEQNKKSPDENPGRSKTN